MKLTTMALRAGAVITAVLAVLIYAFRAPSLAITKVSLEGKVYLVTGCTIGGIGYETAVILAGEMNATVLCTVRSKDKGDAMMQTATLRLQASRGKISYAIVDFASFQSVRAFAQQAISTLKRLDGIVLNAGMHAPRVQITEDGLNQDIQVNHYSQFLLTRLLEDLLVASAPSRLVIISSGVMYNGVLNRTLYEHAARPQTRGDIPVGHMQGLGPYEDSKLMNVLAANAFAEHFRNRNVDVVATSCAPGTVAVSLCSLASRCALTRMRACTGVDECV